MALKVSKAFTILALWALPSRAKPITPLVLASATENPDFDRLLGHKRQSELAVLPNLELGIQNASEQTQTSFLTSEELWQAHEAATQALNRFGNAVFDPDEAQQKALRVGDFLFGKPQGSANAALEKKANELRNFLFKTISEGSATLCETGPALDNAWRWSCLSYIAQSHYSRTNPQALQGFRDVLSQLDEPEEKALWVKLFVHEALNDKALLEVAMVSALSLVPSLLFSPVSLPSPAKFKMPVIPEEAGNLPAPLYLWLKQEKQAVRQLLKAPGEKIALGLSGSRHPPADLGGKIEFLGQFSKRTKALNHMMWQKFVLPYTTDFAETFHAVAQQASAIRFSLSGFSNGRVTLGAAADDVIDLHQGSVLNTAIRRGHQSMGDPFSGKSSITEWELFTVLKNPELRAKTVFELGKNQRHTAESIFQRLIKEDPEIAPLFSVH